VRYEGWAADHLLQEVTAGADRGSRQLQALGWGWSRPTYLAGARGADVDGQGPGGQHRDGRHGRAGLGSVEGLRERGIALGGAGARFYAGLSTHNCQQESRSSLWKLGRALSLRIDPIEICEGL
jgi:hypothetical protein